jgi:hypothetical protein
MNTTDVENYPGFPDGVMGPQLMDDLRKQAERFGAELVTDDVTAMDLISDPKVITVGDQSTTPRRSCWRWARPTATSACPVSPSCPAAGCPGAPTCDGFFFRDQDIVVVGGGDTAVEEATFLTRFAASVTMVHRRDTLRASKVMQQRAFSNDKIRFEWDSEVLEAVGTDRLEGVRLRNRVTGEEKLLPATGCSSPWATTRARSWSRARSSWTPTATSSCARCTPPPPTSPACSPPATWSTTPTGRRSPPPAPAAPRPWTPSATWPRRRTPRPSRTSASTPGIPAEPPDRPQVSGGHGSVPIQ